MTTTPEPVDALTAMRQRLAEMTEDGATLPALAAVVQAEQTKRIADAVEAIANHQDGVAEQMGRLIAHLDAAAVPGIAEAVSEPSLAEELAGLRTSVDGVAVALDEEAGRGYLSGTFTHYAAQLRRALEGGEGRG